MRQKKVEDDEMLVTYLPAPPKDLEGGEGTEEMVEEGLDPTVLAARLAAMSDPAERARLIRTIQGRLGNREAERIITAASTAEEG